MKREQFKRVIMFADSFLLIAAVVISFGYLWNGFYNLTVIEDPFFRKGNYLLIAVYALVYSLIGSSFSAFKVGYSKPLGIIGSQIITLIGTNAVTYLQISLIARGFVPVVPLIVLTLIDIGYAVVWAMCSSVFYRKVYPARKMIIVYGSPSARDLVVKMSMRVDKYIICSSISSDEDLETIKERISQYEAVIICDVPAPKRSKILKYTFEKSIRTYINPKISDIIVRGADEFHMFDTPLLLARNQGLGIEQKFIKRLIDIIGSLVGIVITSPFMLIAAICIKLYDRGPVLYKQERLTEGGRVFKVWKFRSMIQDAEKDGVARLSTEGDSRITPVGRIIRKCRFDELPQFFNILRGDMSFVGPRPERPEIAKQYEESMPEFSFRLKVKAGLTGYAQVFGKYNTTPYDKLKLDLMYIQRHSLALDFKILLMTIKTIFIPDSTEGIAEGATTALPEEPKDNDITKAE